MLISRLFSVAAVVRLAWSARPASDVDADSTEVDLARVRRLVSAINDPEQVLSAEQPLTKARVQPRGVAAAAAESSALQTTDSRQSSSDPESSSNSMQQEQEGSNPNFYPDVYWGARGAAQAASDTEAEPKPARHDDEQPQVVKLPCWKGMKKHGEVTGEVLNQEGADANLGVDALTKHATVARHGLARFGMSVAKLKRTLDEAEKVAKIWDDETVQNFKDADPVRMSQLATHLHGYQPVNGRKLVAFEKVVTGEVLAKQQAVIPNVPREVAVAPPVATAPALDDGDQLPIVRRT